MRQQLIDNYLDYVNDWLTVSRFAEHHQISEEDARILIELGRKYHEQNVALDRELNRLALQTPA